MYFQTLFMQYPRIVVEAVGLGLLLVGLLFFTGYHLYLASTNQTTNERYKRHRLVKSNLSPDTKPNSYSKGVFHNIYEVVFPLGTGMNFSEQASRSLRQRISQSVDSGRVVSRSSNSSSRRRNSSRHSCKF